MRWFLSSNDGRFICHRNFFIWCFVSFAFAWINHKGTTWYQQHYKYQPCQKDGEAIGICGTTWERKWKVLFFVINGADKDFNNCQDAGTCNINKFLYSGSSTWILQQSAVYKSHYHQQTGMCFMVQESLVWWVQLTACFLAVGWMMHLRRLRQKWSWDSRDMITVFAF